MNESISALGSALVVATMLLAMVIYMRSQASSDAWHEDKFRRVMRRRVNGKWQYRPLTEQEASEQVDKEAW